MCSKGLGLGNSLYYIFILASCVFSIVLGLIVIVLSFLLKRPVRRTKRVDHHNRKIIAFFHPYCNAGGGGERVLWVMLKALKQKYPQFHYVVFTGDQGVTGPEILTKVKSTFHIDLGSDVEFIFLRKRYWVEASAYPYFTLLLQSLGSSYLGHEALSEISPDIFIDTMGYSFTYWLARYHHGAKIIAYVHYPIISTDMLDAVSLGQSAFNNQGYIARSRMLTFCKLIYYRLFAKLYGFMGRHADLVMVNSTWTLGHIQKIWGQSCNLYKVYPPCNTESFQSLPLEGRKRFHITSISQFRPEKNHKLQIHAFASLLTRLKEEERNQAKLILIGSCRDAGDEQRVQDLKKLCQQLDITDKVEFALNINFNQLLETIGKCNIGIHTMKNEHFGIGIVELMAAGLIVVAHKSGGPKMDIIRENETGYLAETEQEYSDLMFKIVRSDDNALQEMREKARKDVDRFNEKNFTNQVLESTGPIIENI